MISDKQFKDLVAAVATMQTQIKAMEDKMQLGQDVTTQDLQNIENGILITDLDLRVLELEVQNEQI